MKSKTQSYTKPSFAIGPFIWFAGCNGLKSNFPGGTTYTIRRLVVGIMLVLWAANGFAGELFFEDFSSGNASRAVWNETSGGGTFDASSGDYVLTQPNGQSAIFSLLTGVPEVSDLTDTSIRTQVALDGSSVGVALFARGNLGNPNTAYQGGFNADARRLYLGYSDSGYNGFDIAPFDHDLQAEDLMIQFDVIGNVLSLWAWLPGEKRPLQPQLTYTDTTVNFESGSPGILNAPDSPGTESTATFRFIKVGDTSIQDGPSLGINKGAAAGEIDLLWLPTLDSYIPLESSFPTGPWIPTLARIGLMEGRHQISVPTSKPAQFFQLKLGQQFADDFMGGVKPGWQTNYWGQSPWPSLVTIESTNEQFRIIVAPQSRNLGLSNSVPYVRLFRPDLILKDVTMSMDILAWDHSKVALCALVALQRVGGGSFAALGVGFSSSGDLNLGRLWSFIPGQGVAAGANFPIDFTRHYRLVFTAVNGALDGALFDLEDLTLPLSTHSVFDDSLISGPVGMYFGENDSGPDGGFDITVDNFIATGTQPFQPIMITAQPQSQGVEPGGTVTFSVEAVGEGSLRYQWRLDGKDISEATDSMFTIPSAQLSDGGDYTVVVTDDFDSVTSDPATLTILVRPYIVEHPLSKTVSAGETVIFSVTVTNTATLPIWYRWRKGSVTLTNEMVDGRTANYTIPNVQAMDAGTYTVIVTNAAFHIPGFISDDAVLDVLE